MRKPGPRPQAVERVARAIQKRLVSGDYPADSYLPSERHLARELRASRASVAAAIARLSKMGLVVRHPGRGSYIRPAVEKTIGIVHTVFPGQSFIWNTISTIQSARDGLSPSAMGVREVNMYEWNADPCAWNEDLSALLLIEVNAVALPNLRATLERGVPCVVANLERDFPDLCATYVDHRGVTEQATRLLIDMGHRRIGYVGNEPCRYLYARTLDGYVDGMRQAGIAVDPRLIHTRPGTIGLAGYLGARAMLQRPDRPTAIVAARDGYAEGICEAAEEAGLAIGRDLSVIGFDNLTWLSSRDFLTTFEEPSAKLGELAAAMLLEWILSGERPESRRIDAPLILRRSVGPPLTRHTAPAKSITEDNTADSRPTSSE